MTFNEIQSGAKSEWEALEQTEKPRILAEVEKRLGIKLGETSPDLEHTLETVACLGCCALAPTMVINNEVYGQMTTKKIAEIFATKGDGN